MPLQMQIRRKGQRCRWPRGGSLAVATLEAPQLLRLVEKLQFALVALLLHLPKRGFVQGLEGASLVRQSLPIRCSGLPANQSVHLARMLANLCRLPADQEKAASSSAEPQLDQQGQHDQGPTVQSVQRWLEAGGQGSFSAELDGRPCFIRAFPPSTALSRALEATPKSAYLQAIHAAGSASEVLGSLQAATMQLESQPSAEFHSAVLTFEDLVCPAVASAAQATEEFHKQLEAARAHMESTTPAAASAPTVSAAGAAEGLEPCRDWTLVALEGGGCWFSGMLAEKSWHAYLRKHAGSLPLAHSVLKVRLHRCLLQVPALPVPYHVLVFLSFCRHLPRAMGGCRFLQAWHLRMPWLNAPVLLAVLCRSPSMLLKA